MPFLGMAIGAATGALAGSFADVGIDDSFIAAFGGEHPQLISTNLSQNEEDRLREAFAA